MRRLYVSAKIRNDEEVVLVVGQLHPRLLALARTARLVEPRVARRLRRGEELGDLGRRGLGRRVAVEQVDVREPLQLLELERRVLLQQASTKRRKP